MQYTTDIDSLIEKLVWIEWVDICGFSDSWMDIKDLYEQRPHYCHSIGRLKEATEEYITIVATWDEAGTIVSDMNCIPIGCVTNITQIERKK